MQTRRVAALLLFAERMRERGIMGLVAKLYSMAMKRMRRVMPRIKRVRISGEDHG